MNSIVKILWIVSFAFISISLVLAYGYLPKDMVIYGMQGSSISKTLFFNVFLIVLAVVFFKLRLFQKGIREMNWAFLFPFSKKWRSNPETRDRYRENIETWLTAIFTAFNLIFLCILLLIWGGNDRTIFTYQNIYSVALVIFVFALVLVMFVPPFIINKGPSELN